MCPPTRILDPPTRRLQEMIPKNPVCSFLPFLGRPENPIEMIVLPWLAHKSLAPPLRFGNGIPTTSSSTSSPAPLSDNATGLLNTTTPSALMMKVDPTALTFIMNQTLPLVMIRPPPRSDTPDLGPTKPPGRRNFRPDTPPVPIPPGQDPYQTPQTSYGEPGYPPGKQLKKIPRLPITHGPCKALTATTPGDFRM